MTKYQQYDNSQLLLFLYKGDEVAFTEIYNRFWQKIFAIAYNRLKEVEAAEDVVHDVLVSLWANKEKVEIDNLENYLAIATKYNVLTKIKRKEKDRIYKDNFHPTPIIDIPIETSLHYKYILQLVKQEIEHLPKKCRLIFKYSRDEGKANKQIAKELNISSKTVENQITKAIKQLKNIAKSIFFLPLLFL